MVTLGEIQSSDWYKSRPTAVQKRIDTYPPNLLYRMKETGQIVPIYSYEESHSGECNTCKVQVLRKYNPQVVMDRIVFNVAFECLDAIEGQGA